MNKKTQNHVDIRMLITKVVAVPYGLAYEQALIKGEQKKIGEQSEPFSIKLRNSGAK